MTVNDIVSYLQLQSQIIRVTGDRNQEIQGFSSLYNYREGTLTWLRHISVLEREAVQKPVFYTCVITGKDSPDISCAGSQIWTDNPKECFFQILDAFWGEKSIPVVSPSAQIAEGACIGKDVSVGAFTSISAQTVIGNNCRIGDHVTIKGKVRIGDNCIIQSGSVIGEDGFAFIKKENVPIHVSHYGGVTIEHDVSVGAQTCICRGAIDDTLIKEYARIDNLCHIAHNAVIGRRTVIVAGTVIMGSVHVGDDCWISTSVIRDQRTVGSNSVVGMGAVVVRDVPDHVTVAGNPARPFRRKEEI